MVREIISINIGGCGIHLGETVWRQYCTEHNINEDGSRPKEISKYTHNAFNTFFEETSSGSYISRNLMIDFNPSTINNIKTSKYSRVLSFGSGLVSGNIDSSLTFAHGRYSSDAQSIMQDFDDNLRKIVDNCDNLQGFNINHSVSGGTGSGLSSFILENIAIDYRRKNKTAFEIYPEFNAQSQYEIYNSLLSTHWILGHTELSFVFDNRKVYNLSPDPSHDGMNALITKVESALTTQLRTEGKMNPDLNEYQTNLVPFPRLHFIIPSFAPIITDKHIKRLYMSEATNNLLIDGYVRQYFPQTVSVQQQNLGFEPPLYKGLMQLIYSNHTLNWKNIFKTKSKSKYYAVNMDQDLFNSCCDSQNFMVECLDFDAEEDKNMAITMQCRGGFRAMSTNQNIGYLKVNKKVRFVEWCPTGFKVMFFSECIPMIKDYECDKIAEIDSVTMVFNNASIGRFFSERITNKCDQMFEKKQFWNVYANEGMELEEFTEAREDLGFLEQDYVDVLSEQATEECDSDD